MSDAMWIQGKEYISSKRASELSGYAQDYIGQLARKGLISAQRVGGLWFVSMDSLTEYKSHADTYVPQPPEKKDAPDPDSLVSFDGKDHVSAARAAKITGYHPDYVGQLARTGAVISRQVGNRWYVDREAIVAHKQEKDGLLGAVQAQSVGIARSSDAGIGEAPQTRYNGPGPFLTYTRVDRDLFPTIVKSRPVSEREETVGNGSHTQAYTVPIRKIRSPIPHGERARGRYESKVQNRVRTHGKTMNYGTFRTLAAAALTIVIVLSFGLVTLKNGSVYTTTESPSGAVVGRNMLAGAASTAFEWMRKFAQNLLEQELSYKRVE